MTEMSKNKQESAGVTRKFESEVLHGAGSSSSPVDLGYGWRFWFDLQTSRGQSG